MPKKAAKAPLKKPGVKKPGLRGSALEKKGERKRVDATNWPTDANGDPMIQISFTASELIPTAEYANVTVGPVTVTKFVEHCNDDDLADHLNDLAELVEADCIAVQRDLVLKSLQGSDN